MSAVVEIPGDRPEETTHIRAGQRIGHAPLRLAVAYAERSIDGDPGSNVDRREIADSIGTPPYTASRTSGAWGQDSPIDTGHGPVVIEAAGPLAAQAGVEE